MKPRLFVSFSSKDRDWVRRLLARLQAQPLSVWDYSREEDEIAGGAVLADALRSQIARCDVFVLVLSQASLDNEHVVFEVRSALARRQATPGKPCVIPLITDTLKESTLTPPFVELKQFRYRPFKMDGPVEGLVEALCRDLKVPYQPIPSDDPTFPVLRLLDEEIRGQQARDDTHDVAVYNRLMRAVGHFREAFDSGSIERAYAIIVYVAGMCEYEFAPFTFYYVQVARAVCALLLHRLNDVVPILELLANHPKRDEQYEALLGMLSYYRGEHSNAATFFQRAVDKAKDRRQATTSALAWLLQAHLFLGTQSNTHDIFAQLDAAEVHSEGEWRKLRRLLAFADARLGSAGRAKGRLEELLQMGERDADVLTCYARVLDRLGDYVAARNVLEQHLVDHGNDVLYRQLLGSLCFRTGAVHLALDHFRWLVANHPDTRQHYGDAMEVAWRMGDIRQARALAEALLDSTSVGPPASANDFFIDGLANHMVGRIERAVYDLERSGRSKTAVGYREYLQPPTLKESCDA